MTKLLGWLFFVVLIFGSAAGYYVYAQIPKNSYTVARGDIRSILSATGKLNADKKAEMSFKSTGRVVSVPVTENESIKKGQVLASFDKADLKAAELAAYYKYLAADANAKDVEDQVKDHGSDETFAQKNLRVAAQTARDIAYDNWRIAQRAVRDASLYAPFDAEVVFLDLEVNEWVSAFSQTPQIILIDPSTIYFSAEVDEENIQNLQSGQTAEVSFDAYSNEKFSGIVTEIAKTTTESEGGNIVEAKIKLSTFPDKPIIGISGDVQILMQEKKDVLLIPKQAVIQKSGEFFVRTGFGNLKVKLGLFDGTNWEVLDGLREGDQIRW